MSAEPSRLRPQTGTGPRGRLNIHVAKADREVWEKAERFARDRNVSLSSLVADALARYLADPPKPEER